MAFDFSSAFILITFLGALFNIGCQPSSKNIAVDRQETVDRPNIVFILADDMGWNEVGFNNEHKKYTPHIDKLHQNGLNLTQFYVHAVCAPSRAAFLTGRYPFRTWSDWRTEDFGKPS